MKQAILYITDSFLAGGGSLSSVSYISLPLPVSEYRLFQIVGNLKYVLISGRMGLSLPPHQLSFSSKLLKICVHGHCFILISELVVEFPE